MKVSTSMVSALSTAPWDSHGFLFDVDREWIGDAQTFLHVGLPKLIFIALLTWLLVVLVNLLTGHIVKVAARRETFGVARAAQVRTLASVVRATGIGVAVFLAFLQIMENVLHFNLGPLLASAGVAGVAIGLAAQTIVKDVLNGILILIESQYNVGDVVTIAGITGTVDSMTLRKTTVRGFDGVLYVIPNSQVTNVANQSIDYSNPTMNISVDFSADPDVVIPILERIALEVRNEPAYRDIFLEDPKILGVDLIKGSELIYPISIKTLPRQQFGAIREMHRRIRAALEEHNLLPGSPYRVAGNSGQSAATVSLAAPGAASRPPDPTTAKANESNPFLSE